MTKRTLLIAMLLAVISGISAISLISPAGVQPLTVEAEPYELPLHYEGDATQVVTVVGAPEATTAQLTAWQRAGSSWRIVLGPITAFVGKRGIGQVHEGSLRTPAGTWTLTEGFGNKPSNGYRIPYLQIDKNDWWVSDTNSKFYNQHYRCAQGSCPFTEKAGENLGEAGTAYDLAAVIDYNRATTIPGAGSAFFLHVSTGKPTAGCVAIAAKELNRLLRWLDPIQKPVIEIRVA